MKNLLYQNLEIYHGSKEEIKDREFLFIGSKKSLEGIFHEVSLKKIYRLIIEFLFFYYIIYLTRLVRQDKNMELSIYETKTNFSKLVQLLIDGKEDSIIVSKNGTPVIQLVPICKKNSKRIGIAKKEMEGFDLDLDEFNSIPIEDFGL